jgi:hypothetical protein
VLGEQAGAALVVVGDDVHPRQPGLARTRHDHREPLSHRPERGGVGQRADHDQPVHPEVQEGTGRILSGTAVETGVGQEHAQAVVVEQGVQTVEQVHEPGVAQVVQQDPDRAGALLAEAAGGGVRTVAELAHGPQHGLPLLRAHLVGAAQHE